MTKDDARAVIYATAKLLHVGELMDVPKQLMQSAFDVYNPFEHPDFVLIDRTTFYQIRRIKR